MRVGVGSRLAVGNNKGGVRVAGIIIGLGKGVIEGVRVMRTGKVGRAWGSGAS